MSARPAQPARCRMKGMNPHARHDSRSPSAGRVPRFAHDHRRPACPAGHPDRTRGTRYAARWAVRRQPAPPRDRRRVSAAGHEAAVCLRRRTVAPATSTFSRRSSPRAVTNRRRRSNRFCAGRCGSSTSAPTSACSASTRSHAGWAALWSPSSPTRRTTRCCDGPRPHTRAGGSMRRRSPMTPSRSGSPSGSTRKGAPPSRRTTRSPSSAPTCSRSPPHTASISSRWTSRVANGRSSPTPRLAQLAVRVLVMEWHEHRCPHASPRAYAGDLLAAAGFVHQWHEPGRFASNGLLWAWR
jgi:hypothetical protein